MAVLHHPENGLGGGRRIAFILYQASILPVQLNRFCTFGTKASVVLSDSQERGCAGTQSNRTGEP
jgi:hypothetical protein